MLQLILYSRQALRLLAVFSSAYSETTVERSFFSLDNPLIVSVIGILIVFVLSILFYKYVIIPMQKRHLEEERNIRKEYAELMAMFAELDPEPVFRVDDTGKVIMSNKASSNLLGVKRLENEKLSDLIPEFNSINISNCIVNGSSRNFIAHIDGKVYNFTIIGISKLKIAQIYGNDITELKENEQKLQFALTKAEESEKLKTYFLAQMSHEIRTPLTALLGSAGIIKEEFQKYSTKDLEFTFESLESTSKRLYRTIDLILNMSQLMTDNYNIKLQKIFINEALQTIIAQYISQAKEKNLSIRYSEKINNPIIYFDNSAFFQIFDNLIDNAIKFTKEGKVEILVYENKKNNICVDIIDTGIGMTKEFMEKIFSPFTQERMGYNRPFEGNGLGLALAKKLAQLNNADIYVESEKGKGSTFTVEFFKY